MWMHCQFQLLTFLFARDISKLAKVSFLSIVFVIFIGTCVFIRFFTLSGEV